MINLDKIKEKLKAFQGSEPERIREVNEAVWEVADDNPLFQAYDTGFAEGYYRAEPRKYKEEFKRLQPYYDNGFEDGERQYYIDMEDYDCSEDNQSDDPSQLTSC